MSDGLRLTASRTEHADRVPDCVFFTRQTAGGKRAAKAKAPRLSKASRLSAQSVMTIGESVADLPAEYDDSVMTTASTLTQGGKKATRAKKAAATTAKGRKTRAKKDDVVEILEDDEVDATAETIAPPPPPKTARGRKRKSDAMDESVATIAEAPAPKKRATKQRGSAAVDASVDDMTLSQDVDVTEAGAKPAKRIAAGRKKATATKAGKGRTSATSNTSVMSHDAPAITMMADLPDEEELNRQLEADFDRPLSDVEDLAADSDSERRRRSRSSGSSEPPKKGRGVEVQPHGKSSSGDFAMFDPTPVEADEAAVDAELRALEAEMAASEQPETLHVPKKGARKLPAAPRKVSKQTAARRAKAALAKAKAEEEGQAAAEAEAVEEPAADAAAPTIKKGRPRKKTASGGSEETAPVETERGNGNIKTARPDTSSPARPLPALPGTPPRRSSGGRSHGQQQRAAEPAEVAAAVANTAPQHPSPPAAAAIIATPSAKQAQLSPSASPQSSDAENMPPSSSQAAASSAARRISGGGGGPGGRVAAAVAAAEAQRHPAPPAAAQAKEGKRVALAPAATPVRPARTRNAQYTAQTPGGMVGGLRSTTPWTAADLDAVFLREDDGEGRDGESPEAEDDEEEEEDEFLRMLRRAQRGQQAGAGRPAGRAAVTSPERGMTVEQWIYHNAGLAEKRLRQECEAVVTAFEREGGRAMTALEAVVVAE